MTYKSIRAAMRRAGFLITEADKANGRYFTVAYGLTHTIEWYEGRREDSSGAVQALYVKRNGVEDDYQTDYFAGSFVRTIRGAIKMASEEEFCPISGLPERLFHGPQEAQS